MSGEARKEIFIFQFTSCNKNYIHEKNLNVSFTIHPFLEVLQLLPYEILISILEYRQK